MSDSALLRLTVAALAAAFLWFALRGALPDAWRTPGSPALYLTGVAGVLLLLVPFAFVVAKRGGSASPVAWSNAHVACSFAGMVLIVIHSGGYPRRAPALRRAPIGKVMRDRSAIVGRAIITLK